jgi:hypothetical protein
LSRPASRAAPPIAGAPDQLVRFLVVLAVVLPAFALAETPPGRCDELPAGRALDFWLGDWEVTGADGTTVGTNRITPTLGGCAVQEHWTGTDGFEGRSLFYFHSWLGQWRQVWITGRPQQPGAVKEKRQVMLFEGPGIRFRGEIMVSPEHYLQDRTTLTPLPDGRVHQLVQSSNDDGRTWQTSFEGWYRRVGP